MTTPASIPDTTGPGADETAPDEPAPAASADAAPAPLIVDDVLAYAAALPRDGRLLGLDLGSKTIGLALSDVTRLIASPLETIKRVKLRIDTERLMAVVATHRIAGLVLGLPINLDGNEGPRAQSTRAFAKNLAGLHGASLPPLLLWDERLTTQAAERVLLEADQSRRRRAEVIDKMAAALILQSALDRIGRL